MFKNSLILTFRNIIRNKVYFTINVLGLAVGMACCFLLLIFLMDEISYDKFHKRSNRIYRVIGETEYKGNILKETLTQEVLTPNLRLSFPAFEQVTRLQKSREKLIRYQEKTFYEARFFHADDNFFEIFSFKFLQGDPQTALVEPNSVVITESIKMKYFGSINPIGKIINFENRKDYKVTAVIEDVPHNSHFHFDFLGRYEEDPAGQEWYMYSVYTYVLLQENIHADHVKAKLSDFVTKNIKIYGEEKFSYTLQPLKDIHLRSNTANEIEANSDERYLMIFGGIAFLILLMACFNYMNLAIALSLRRSKEVGIRKVLGARRSQLVRHFLVESLVFSLVAFIAAIVLVETALPVFSGFLQRPIGHEYLTNSMLLPGFLILALLTGFLAGSYPAFILSARRGVLATRDGGLFTSSKFSLRKIFIVGQFVITSILICTTLVIYYQLVYMQNKKLGFDKERIIIVSDISRALGNRGQAFKDRLLQFPYIVKVASGQIPGRKGGSFWGMMDKDNQRFKVQNLHIDHDYIETLNIKILKGRAFSEDFKSDLKESVVINEAASQYFTYSDTSKNYITLGRSKFAIVGVLQNFHLRALHQPIEPMVFTLKDKLEYTFLVKVAPSSLEPALETIQTIWREFVPNRPLTYSFLDEELNLLYNAEQKLAQLIAFFALIAILIASLGLFGLIAYSADQHTKEIGIRKVLGATVTNIVTLLSMNFIKLVILANAVALPAAYFISQRWLENYAYRIDQIQVAWLFAFASGLALIIAILTVCTQAIKAALLNPVEALKCE